MSKELKCCLLNSSLTPQAFGQSFLQPDIHLFKQNLFYLETLNTKQKLYHKVSALLSWKDPS